jgi:outer membrane receptor for ferrienterochelin and colicin
LTLYRNRDFQNRYLGAVSNNNFTGGDISNKNIDNLFTLTNINNSAFNFVDQTSPSDKYTAKAMTNSAYIMSDNRFNTRLRAVWGVRLESYSLNLNSPELTNKNQKVNPVWNDFLPSLNMSYALSEKSNLRMSYFRSVARPELREIAPISYYDYELNMLINGNANLTRSRIDNIDLRYEVFPNAGEVFSASLFFKNFDKTIENKFYSVGSSSEIKTINYNSATNAGVELELRKKLDFISKNDFFKNLTFYANLAIIKSSVSLKGDDQKYLDKQEYARTSRPMSGQSPYVINTSIAYSTPDGKLNFNVLYNRIGQRIYIVGGEGQFADLYESPRNILDFQVSWNASKRSEFRLNVKDMLNAPVFFYYDQNANKKFDHPVYTTTSINPYQDYTFQKYRQGSTFSLTYTYRF